MKRKCLRFCSILAGVVFFLVIFGLNPVMVKANEELYFDGDGNLYYIAREKKATSSIKYYTIGWIIKRYDMPINVSGQQYVIVTKSNYKPDMEDPEDNTYVYCYYRSDKEEILNAIKTVSMEWYNVLNKYGDTVYIDSVMTVLEDGTQQGFLYSGGSYTGEVYFDYEGISGAREWASPESLLVNFGMSVEFPVLYKPLATTIQKTASEKVSISNALFSSAVNGSYDYDISKGIPAGEQLYAKASVTSGIYNFNLDKITGRISICVAVPVTYVLRWTDYYGVFQEETKEIRKYYLVYRDFTYYQYMDYDEKLLMGMTLEGDLLEGEYSVAYDNVSVSNIDEGSIRYEGLAGHVLGFDVAVADVEPVVLTSDTYIKPTITEEDYTSYADEMVSQVKVRNDKLVVKGSTLMSDEVKRKETDAPTGSFSIDNASLELDELIIDKKTLNGEGYEINGIYIFEDSEGEVYEYKVAGLKPVTVHTPVVCNSSFQGEKELNQAVTPTASDVVLGTYMTVSFNDYGKHKDIPGYGINSYGKYVWKRQIVCDFHVEYMGERYEAGSIIEVAGYYAKLYICEDNNEGIGNVDVRTLAYNIPEGAVDSLCEYTANLSRNKYGASSSGQVRLIGRIEGFNITNKEGQYFAEDMPVKLLELQGTEEELSYVMEINTLGDVGEEDYIKVKYNYYVRHEDEIIPVWIYEIDHRNILLGESLRLVENEEIWSSKECSLNGNKGKWIMEKDVPEETIIVAAGTTENAVWQAIESDKIQDITIKNDVLYLAAEFIRYKDGEAYISYINEENARNGYCNMWLRENGATVKPYGTYMEIGVSTENYFDYEVSGTH